MGNNLKFPPFNIDREISGFYLDSLLQEIGKRAYKLLGDYGEDKNLILAIFDTIHEAITSWHEAQSKIKDNIDTDSELIDISYSDSYILHNSIQKGILNLDA